MTAPLVLNGCGSVEVHDAVWYGNKGELGAVEFHTLTTDEFEIDKTDWDTVLASKPLVCTSVETFGDVKIAIEQLCSVCNCCTYDTKAAIDQFFSHVKQVKMGEK